MTNGQLLLRYLRAGGPPRPPDRADMNTSAQRTKASREASAYDLVNRIFNAILPNVGRNRVMPMVYFGRTPGRHPVLDPEAAPVAPAAAAYPARYRGTGYPTGVVSFPHGGNLAMDEPRTRQFFIDTLLHELAHTQQNPHQVRHFVHGRTPNDFLRTEGGADAFAMLMRNRLAELLGFAAPPTPYRGYGPLGRQFLARYGRDYALRGQFQRG